MKLTKEILSEMAQVDIRTVDISQLTDLRDIKIDTSQPVEKKTGCLCRTDKERLCQPNRGLRGKGQVPGKRSNH